MTNTIHRPGDQRRFGTCRRRATTTWALAIAYRSILLAATTVPLLLAACNSTPPASASADDRSSEAATTPRSASTAPATGGAGARSLAVDDGARIVADRMLQAIRAVESPLPTGAVVSLGGLENLSAASEAEFDAFRTRLAALLGAALAPAGLGVVPDVEVGPAFVISGSAYLDMFQGFNAWDLWLSLTRSSDQQTLWTADGQVRVLRSPPPAGVQVFPPRSWLDAQAAPALWYATEGGRE